MRFDYQVHSSLPPLAWLMVVRLADDAARIIHGEWVEARENFFVEGVWDGAFGDGGFDRTDVFFGSGVVFSSGQLTVVPSAATTDAVYYRQQAKSLMVSNSLPLVLASDEGEFDPRLADYVAINKSIQLGIGKYARDLPTTSGKISRLLFRNLVVQGNEVRLEEKPWPPRFTTYHDYEQYLTGRTARVLQNARDLSRKRTLHIYSTQSTGYDSTAINAMLARQGIDMVFTIPKGKGAGRFGDQDSAVEVSDDGGEICATLGLKNQPVERRAFEQEGTDEYLFYCAVHDTGDLSFMGMMKHIHGPAVLLTGCLGEIHASHDYYLAYYGRDLQTADFERGDLGGGHGLGEVRLMRGFITVPPFYVGARRREEIMQITESGEMNPWRLRNDYDRPIARRLAEERGVPRDAFGQRKKAAAVVLSVPNLPAGKRLRDEYRRYLVSSGWCKWWQVRVIPIAQRINALIWFASPRRYRGIYFTQRLISRLLGSDFHFSLVLERLQAALFCFSVNKRADEYRKMLVLEKTIKENRNEKVPLA